MTEIQRCVGRPPCAVVLGRGAFAFALGLGIIAFAGSLPMRSLAQRAASQPVRTGRAPERQSVRVIVERFRGTRAASARALLVANLTEAGYRVVPDEEVERVRRALGLGARLEPTDYVALARELDAAAIIEGRVARARRAWTLSVRVRNGADGALLGTETWGGRSTSAIDAVGRTGAERLGDYLRVARAPSRTAEASAPAATTPQWYEQGYAMDEEQPPGVGAARDREPTDSDRYETGRLVVFGGTLWRSFGTVVDVYSGQHGGTTNPSAIAQQERSYVSAGIGHFELGGEGEIYPGAFGDEQPFPYLGLVASFRHSVGLSSTAPASDPVNGDVSLPTNQMDLRVALRGRYRVGPRRGDFMMFLDAGFVMSTFTFGLNELARIQRNSILPPMEYQSVDLGLGFEVAAVPDALSVQLYGRGRIGVGIGAQSRNVWGIETKPANGFLVGAEVRHDAMWIARGVSIGLRFEYFGYITQFRGQVGCYDECPPVANPWEDRSLWEVWPVRDPSDPNSAVIGGPQDPVTDHNVRWGLHVGYAFD